MTTAVVSTAAATSIGPTRARNQAPSPAAGPRPPTGPGDDDGERPRGRAGRDAGDDGDGGPARRHDAHEPGDLGGEHEDEGDHAPGPDAGILARRLGPHADRAP